jgi:hypothetical protein
MRCESGDQRDDEECECDGRAAALQRHCGVSATGEWRQRRGGGVSEGLGLEAPREWGFYTATSTVARVCLGGRWARRPPVVDRLGRAHAGLLPMATHADHRASSGCLFRVVSCLAQRAWGEAQARPKVGFVLARPNSCWVVLMPGQKNRASCRPTKPGRHGQVYLQLKAWATLLHFREFLLFMQCFY